MELTGPPTWGAAISGQPYLSFDGATEYLECDPAESADLNFTSEDITLLAWMYNSAAAGTQLLFDQGRVDVDGWQWFLANANLAFRTNQAGARTEIGAVDGVLPNVWQLTGLTRIGAVGQFYRNGAPIPTLLNGGITDAVSVAGGRKLLVGVQENEISDFFTGLLAIMRIYNRALSPGEMAQVFAAERSRFGV